MVALKSVKSKWEDASLRDKGASLTSVKYFWRSWARSITSMCCTLSLIAQGQSPFCTCLLRWHKLCRTISFSKTSTTGADLSVIHTMGQDSQSSLSYTPGNKQTSFEAFFYDLLCAEKSWEESIYFHMKRRWSNTSEMFNLGRWKRSLVVVTFLKSLSEQLCVI